ncbi:hypothetical protein [Sediminibacterium sp. TEGAF015]|uniref:hypothetical protein n=1 Tax=Sediminibacterium sp. TEGAF015 TaxID=575378 RepID=UPI002207F456|nr:hypothetical protein [Sediminibacterium sp. TEGAF015]BDQ11338.1 hypothetical protein TEGAF0_05550 [Sediminibacterium sp. TEGAF015]
MQINLIQGQFSATEAVALIEQLLQIKISFHEKKISMFSSEEEIKFRETKIKRLQEELASFRKQIVQANDTYHLEAICNFEKK